MTVVPALRDRFVELRPRTRRAAVGAGLIAASLLVSASIFATGPRATPEARTEKAWPVSVVTIEPQSLAPTFNAFGRIESAQVARIQTDLVAPIAAVHVSEGDWVEADQVLIELETDALSLLVREREADLAAARAALASVVTEEALAKNTSKHYESVFQVAQKKLERHRDLFEKRMIAQSLLDEAVQQSSAATIEYQNHLRVLADLPNRIAEARARIARSEALLDAARIDLEHATIRAPFAGPVLSVAASPGNHTALGVPLVEVASAAHMEVRTQIPDAYADRVRGYLESGRGVRATLVDGSGRTLHLARLAGNVRPGQSGLDGFFVVDAVAGAPQVDLGRVIDIQVELPPEPRVVALPVQSIYENDRIYQVIGDRLEAVTVERVGDFATAAGEYRVLVRADSLQAGQQIITTQLPKAISGLLVQPIG